MDQEKNLCEYSERITCEIPFRLPSLNEYIRACRSNKYEGYRMKADVEKDIIWFINNIPKFENPVIIEFTWIEENKRRDLDNIAFAKKFILDALVKAGKLKNDNRRNVTAFRDYFDYSNKSKVILKFFEKNV